MQSTGVLSTSVSFLLRTTFHRWPKRIAFCLRIGGVIVVRSRACVCVCACAYVCVCACMCVCLIFIIVCVCVCVFDISTFQMVILV